jgi:hypothetical protein
MEDGRWKEITACKLGGIRNCKEEYSIIWSTTCIFMLSFLKKITKVDGKGTSIYYFSRK